MQSALHLSFTTSQFTFNKGYSTEYVIDFGIFDLKQSKTTGNMTQTNKDTGAVKSIRRSHGDYVGDNDNDDNDDGPPTKKAKSEANASKASKKEIKETQLETKDSEDFENSLDVDATLTGRTYLVTGAGEGIGLGFVKNLLARGRRVVAAVLSLADASDVMKLQQAHSDRCFVHEMDVTSEASVIAFVTWLKGLTIGNHGKAIEIDAVINNAGVYFDKSTSLADVHVDLLNKQMQVNAIGPVRVVRALLPFLSKPKKNQTGGPHFPLVLNISSRQGSLQMAKGAMKIYFKSYGYKMSKAAQNMFALVLSLDHPEICVVAVHPGFVITKMTKMKASLSVDSSTNQLISLADKLKLADSGSFLDVSGKPLAW